MTNPVDIGERVKNQRELLGMTREDLAERLDITPRFCYDLELGLKGMSLATLSKLSVALDISSDYLLFGESLEDCGLASSMSLIKSCPADKRKYLNAIISSYLEAVR